jgi:hypothetical protein
MRPPQLGAPGPRATPGDAGDFHAGEIPALEMLQDQAGDRARTQQGYAHGVSVGAAILPQAAGIAGVGAESV